MARVIEEPDLLEQPVSSVMDPPFPVVDADTHADAIARLLGRETPAVLVQRDGELAGIVTRYDMVRYLTR